ncbi:MAG: hypothetical protein ACKVIF_05180 [Rhodospirillales bacterium]|jgi:transposase-like protein
MKNHNPFRYFKTSPEIIRLAVMMYVRFPLSLRNVEELLQERGVDICHETVAIGGIGSVQFCQRDPQETIASSSQSFKLEMAS